MRKSFPTSVCIQRPLMIAMHNVHDAEAEWYQLMRTIVHVSTTRSVPRPIARRVDTPDASYDTSACFEARPGAFPQQRVYAHMPVNNHPLWFECSVCADLKFSPTDAATQHTPKHPPLCTACLARVDTCPFCREAIGNVNRRRACLRILFPFPLPAPLRRHRRFVLHL